MYICIPNIHNIIIMDFFHLHLGDVFPPNSQTTRGADFVVGSLKIGEGAIFVLVWKGVRSAFVKICGVANLQSRSMEIVPAPSSRCCAAYELVFCGAKTVRTMNEGGGGKG